MSTPGQAKTLRMYGVLETCLYGDDLEAMGDFYARVLNLELSAREQGRHVFFKCGRQMFLVFNPTTTGAEADTPHGAGGPGHVAFSVPAAELEEWKAHLQMQGVRIESDHGWPNGARSLYFRDPAGNCLELACPQVWGMAEPDAGGEESPA